EHRVERTPRLEAARELEALGLEAQPIIEIGAQQRRAADVGPDAFGCFEDLLHRLVTAMLIRIMTRLADSTSCIWRSGSGETAGSRRRAADGCHHCKGGDWQPSPAGRATAVLRAAF